MTCLLKTITYPPTSGNTCHSVTCPTKSKAKKGTQQAKVDLNHLMSSFSVTWQSITTSKSLSIMDLEFEEFINEEHNGSDAMIITQDTPKVPITSTPPSFTYNNSTKLIIGPYQWEQRIQ